MRPWLGPLASVDVWRKNAPKSSILLLFFFLAAVEIIGQAVIRARVPSLRDWQRAAAFVRAQSRPGDLVVSAPRFTDRIALWQVGDRIALKDAGRSDLAGYKRLWSLSIRGARPEDAPQRSPEVSKRFGAVRVERWTLNEPSVLYDFVDHVAEATVDITVLGSRRSCPWTDFGSAAGGGLFAGPLAPAKRFACDPARPWLWVGPTTTEDLEMRPRRCVWQHPAGADPITSHFKNVPLGNELVLYGGLYYMHERALEGGPVVITVRVNGHVVGQMNHRDGDGFKRVRFALRGTPDRGDVDVEVSAREPHLRTLCWSATTRSTEVAR